MDTPTRYLHHVSSPLGGITMLSDGEALLALCFDGQRGFARAIPAQAQPRALPVFAQTEAWLRVYFSGREPDFRPPLAPQGTAFSREVWELLAEIPYGETRSYGELARRLAAQRGRTHPAAQAVGGAVGRNPIALLIPCHRVVGAQGALTGYAAGLERKRALLRLEAGEPCGDLLSTRGND